MKTVINASSSFERGNKVKLKGIKWDSFKVSAISAVGTDAIHSIKMEGMREDGTIIHCFVSGLRESDLELIESSNRYEFP